MDKGVIDGIEFINQAIKQSQIDRIRDQWTVQLPLMTKDNFVPFEDYKKRFICDPVTLKSDIEILAEARAIEKKLKEGGKE